MTHAYLAGMRRTLELEKTRTHLALALDVLQHDRWLLGGVRDGRLRVIADSTVEDGSHSVQPIYVELSALARRCLYERHPLAVTSIVEPKRRGGDWETDWPALIYAPVGIPRARPVGLLVVGSRTERWYTQEEIDYVSALGVTLTTAVSCYTGPLGRLAPAERRIAVLVAEGLSDAEIARAVGSTTESVTGVVVAILRKLSARSRADVRSMVPGAWSASRPAIL